MQTVYFAEESNTDGRRKMASIQVIKDISPIDGADRIEVAKILGWNVVVRKGEFCVGQPIVFFEIDSIIPKAEWSEFLKPPHRLRTVKLRGVISQGLVMPVTILPEGLSSRLLEIPEFLEAKMGLDVSKILKVTKYEIPQAKQAYALGAFPYFIPKTDELRVQSYPQVLDEMRGKPYLITQKLDGSSGTFWMRNGEFGLASRNLTLEFGPDHDSVWHFVARKYNLPAVLPDGFAVQGEVVGPSVQRNPMGLTELDLQIFNVWDINKQEYLRPADALTFCDKHGLTHVPVLEFGSFDYTEEGLLERAKGEYPNGSPQEGIVVRPLENMVSAVLKGRMSFKAINNDFLLSEK